MSTTYEIDNPGGQPLLLTTSAAGGGFIRAELRTYTDVVIARAVQLTAAEAISEVVSNLLRLAIQVGEASVQADCDNAPCHGCGHTIENHPNDSGCQEWHSKGTP